MLGCRRPDESATPRLSAGRALADGVLRPFFRTMGMVDSSRGVPPKGGLNELQMDTQQGLSSPPAPPPRGKLLDLRGRVPHQEVGGITVDRTCPRHRR